jgi:hypothetical protein
MWLRIAVRYGVRFTPKVLVKIRVSADSMSAPKNADKMLGNELRVLRKLFSNPTLPVNTCDRGKAFSSRYIAAARAFHTVGNAREARLALKRAILSNPVYFMRQKKHWAMMACIMASSWRR